MRAPATSTVNLAGGEVEVAVIDGSGPPLVFLHEGLGSLGLWRDFPRRVAERTGRRAVVWSRHGYGFSAVVPEPRAAGYMHHEALVVLPELFDRLAIDAPVLVGHSDGASIALVHAGGSGRAVSGVVAIAPHVMVEEVTLAAIRDARHRYLTTDLASRMKRHHADPDATFWGWNDVWLSEPFRAWNIEEYLPGITCPVLCVQHEVDPYGTAAQLQRIEAGCAGPVELLVVPGEGHAPYLSAPELVAGAVAGFAGAAGPARRVESN